MAGHSKWNNIKNKKGKEDARRGKIFTKLARSIIVAVREGGADPDYNPSLKTAIEKAKAENMPNENIERAIKKGAGDGEEGQYEEILYEGYGPEGVAVVVRCLSDNRNRTASDVRHAFDKNGGNLGQSGSVLFMFNYVGIIGIAKESLDEEQVMMDALDLSASDFKVEEDGFVITTEASDFACVRDGMVSRGYEIEFGDLVYVPSSETVIESEENRVKMQKLIDMLDDLDDVQEVYHNWNGAEE